MTDRRVWTLLSFVLAIGVAVPVGADVAEDLAREAHAAYEAGDPATCLRLYRQALDAGRESRNSPYHAARCAALSGEPEAAHALLRTASERGWRDLDHLRADPDLAALRGTPAWAETIAVFEAESTAFRASIHTELYELYQADQADRRVANPDPDHWQGVQARDIERREWVLALLAEGAPRAADDFFHAAMVLQHGGAPDHYKQAHELAKKAVALDPRHSTAKWLSAAAWDRYLWNTDQPQIYGTQFRREGDSPWTQEPFDRDAVSDEARRALGVPALAESQKRLETMNARFEAPPAAAEQGDDARDGTDRDGTDRDGTEHESEDEGASG